MNTYTEHPDLNQAFWASNPPIETNPSINLIDEYARSPRGDLRVNAAILTIEWECAETEREAPTTSHYACGGIAPPEDAPPPATQPVSNPAIGHAPVEHALQAQQVGKRVIHRLRLKKATDLSPKPSRRAPKPLRIAQTAPLKRPARARAVHSHVAHGGVRKRDDGDSGGGDGPPGTAPTRFYIRPDGTVWIEQDDGPDYIVSTEFGSIGEAVRMLLDFEVWAKANGTWIGPSHLDPEHPLYPIICMGLN